MISLYSLVSTNGIVTEDLLQYVNITILCRRMLLLILIIRVPSNRVQIILLLNWHS